MKKNLILAVLILAISAIDANAQTRKSVSAAEVNGTFRSDFVGRYRNNYNEIKILALGGGKLRVAFQLVYPYTTGTGEFMANTGEAFGEANIEGDTATFSPPDTDGCVITIKFVKRGTIRVSQEGVSDCGFGLNVSSEGVYKKTSSIKPKLQQISN